MTVRERLKEFLRDQRISQAEFARAIGVSTGYVNAIQKGIGSDVILAIQEQFPDLSILWLLTGEGPMLHSQAAAGAVPPGPAPIPDTAGTETSTNNNMTKDDFLQILKRKDDQLSELIYQNRVLTDVIARLTGAEHTGDTNSPPP